MAIRLGQRPRAAMVLSTQPQPKPPAELLAFLQQKLGLSDNALELGLRQAELEQAPLPIVLWSFGLLNLLQYQEVLEWQRRLGQL
jgi:hypothetical protein